MLIMAKCIHITLLWLFLATHVFSQSADFKWVRQLGGGGDETPHDIALDSKGNIITVGSFNYVADFDPGFLTYYLASANEPEYLFISKLNSQGNFVWAKQLGNKNCTIHANSVAIDLVGNIFVTGDFYGKIDFDPGPAQHTLTPSWGTYVLKLDPEGNFLWVAEKMAADSKAIAVDATGNSYFTGEFLGEIFVSKIDTSGNFVWSCQTTGQGQGYPTSIAISTQGNIFVTGVFDVTMDFDPGAGVFTLTPVAGLDVFVLKLSNDGALVWAGQFSGLQDEFSMDIVVDDLENTYSTGMFRANTDFDPGPGTYTLRPHGLSDCYITKQDSSGKLIWVQRLGSVFGPSYGQGIALDTDANVYTVGGFYDRLDQHNSDFIIPLIAKNNSDAFISKHDSSGKFLWAKQIGGSKHDGGMSLAVDASKNIFTTGYFYDATDFDPNPGTFTINAFGNRDIFIHKMSSCTPAQKMFVTAVSNTACIDDKVFLTAGGANTYTWQSGSTGNSLLTPAAYFYYVYGTDQNGCSSTATFEQNLKLCTGIESYNGQMPLMVYPNPSAGKVYIQPGFTFNECRFELCDIDGRVLQKGLQRSSEKMELDFSDLNCDPGLYFLKLYFDDRTMVTRAILLHD